MTQDRLSARIGRSLTAYVAHRLRSERASHGRPYYPLVARETGFSRVHVSLVAENEKSVGPDFGDAIAKFWGLQDYSELATAARDWTDSDEASATDVSDASGRGPRPRGRLHPSSSTPPSTSSAPPAPTHGRGAPAALGIVLRFPRMDGAIRMAMDAGMSVRFLEHFAAADHIDGERNSAVDWWAIMQAEYISWRRRRDDRESSSVPPRHEETQAPTSTFTRPVSFKSLTRKRS